MAVTDAPLADTPPPSGPRGSVPTGGDAGGITAAVPGLAALVDVDEADAPYGAVSHAQRFEPCPRTAISGGSVRGLTSIALAVARVLARSQHA